MRKMGLLRALPAAEAGCEMLEKETTKKSHNCIFGEEGLSKLRDILEP